MILNAVRAYTPEVEYKFNAFRQLSLAQVQALNQSGKGSYPLVIPVRISTSLIHRKVWAWLWSVGATWAASVDIIARLNGRIVLEHDLMRYSTAAVNEKFLFGFQQMTTFVGMPNENLLTVVANNTNISVAPMRLNISCDEMLLRINSISGAVSFDAGLHIQSQAGI